MRHAHHYGSCWEGGSRWDHIGHAAERFARRVARDASKFAERVQEHAGELAHDIARETRRSRGDEADSDPTARPDVRKIFEDVRDVVSGIADGVDELIDRIFPQQTQPSSEEWTRVVTNRSGSCSKCGSEVAMGDECFVRGEAGRRELRCVGCGPGEAGSL
jgi:hypothetical protein